MRERTQLEARLLSAAELEVVNASRLPAIKQASDERFGESKSAQAVAESGVWGMLAPWRAEFSVRQLGVRLRVLRRTHPNVSKAHTRSCLVASFVTYGSQSLSA